jgi:hypothetical protein
MICLTFDTDHCDEPRLREWLAACRFPGRGTIFCTQPFAFLGAGGHEIAPHPFLDGTDWEAEIGRWHAMFPEARSWRSHSLACSQYALVCLGRLGYEIVSTVEMFGSPAARPLQSPWGVWQLPIYSMDNSDFARRDFGTLGALEVFDRRIVEAAVAGDGLYVFDFHPVHYLLNTPSYRYYEERVPAFRKGADTAALRFGGYGTASFFDDLVRAMDARGMRSLTLHEALQAWRGSQAAAPSVGHRQ